jgi:hypothetical protein
MGYAVAVATDEYCEASVAHQEDTNGVDIHLPYLRSLGFPQEIVGTNLKSNPTQTEPVNPNMASQQDDMDPAYWSEWINVGSVAPSAGKWGTAESPIQCHRIDPKGDASLGDVHDKGSMLLNIAEYYKVRDSHHRLSIAKYCT